MGNQLPPALDQVKTSCTLGRFFLRDGALSQNFLGFPGPLPDVGCLFGLLVSKRLVKDEPRMAAFFA